MNPSNPLRRAARWLPPLVVACTAVLANMPAPAYAAPVTPAFGPAIDDYAANDPQSTCDPVAKPGVIDFRDLLNGAYGAHTAYIIRSCATAGTSEHEEGRALDYMLDVNNTGERAIADDVLAWLLATDRHGNRHANARRLGIMYIIWNRQIWGSYRADEGWRAYSCDGTPGGCHTNHIHFSFSWAGAQRRTSWWTAPVYRQAPGYADVNADGHSDLVSQNTTDTWVMLSNGSSFGAPVRWSNVAFQGQVSNHIGDVDNDGRADLVAQNATDTWVMLSSGSSFGAPVRWSNVAFSGSLANHLDDVNNDGRADLIAQNAGSVWVMPSSGTSFGPPVRWSNVAFSGDLANHIGDVDNDGRADLIAQNSTGTWVMLSNGSSYGAPGPRSAVAFFGRVANFG